MATRPRRTDPARLAAFSDGVFAIVLTLLVLDLLPGEHAQSPEALLDAWPTYLAFLTAFLTVGAIWLSHHSVFGRVALVEPRTLVLNLLVLLGTSLVPWPTALISAALRAGSAADETAAMLVYSLVSVLIGLPLGLLALHLARRPRLLDVPGHVPWMRGQARSSFGSLVVAAVGTALAFVVPVAALVLYLVVPLVFLVLTLRDREPEGG